MATRSASSRTRPTRATRPRIWSNRQNNDNYDPRALATQHIQLAFRDNANIQSGTHVPIGLKVVLRALNWGNPYADDFVILDYAHRQRERHRVARRLRRFLDRHHDRQHREHQPLRSPGAGALELVRRRERSLGPLGRGRRGSRSAGGPHPTHFAGRRRPGHLDDLRARRRRRRGARHQLGRRPSAGHAIRRLSPRRACRPCRTTRGASGGVPAQDSWYREYEVVGNDTIWADELSPGKYQVMSNGAFTVGVTQETDYTIPFDWVSLLSVGPFAYLAPDDTIHVTYAIICGADSLAILANSRVAQVAYDDGFSIPAGPPSPGPRGGLRLEHGRPAMGARRFPGRRHRPAALPRRSAPVARAPHQHHHRKAGLPGLPHLPLPAARSSTRTRTPWPTSWPSTTRSTAWASTPACRRSTARGGASSRWTRPCWTASRTGTP